MTAIGPRRLIAVLTLAFLALAVSLTGTAHATLTGSAFDTSNGAETASTALSWQNVAGSPRLGTELGGSTCFGGGEKELTPDKWTFVTGTPCSPAKSDLLGTFSYNETTASDSFLHLAYDRAATTGDTFITFELNQSNATWTNSAGATVPCRTNNDLLLSYQLSSGSVTITAYKWTGDGTGPTACPNGASGAFTQATSLTQEGSVNAASITNYLSTGTLGTSFAGGTYGEGTVAVQSVIQNLGLGCISYIQLQAHTRSSSSISSSLIGYMAPMPVQVGSCAAAGTVYNNTAGDGTHHAGESGLGGATVYVDMTNAGHYVVGDPTATTDSSGYYLLSGVAAGSHPVGVVPPAGYECTSPASPCTHTVSFSTTANALGQDFELFAPPVPAPSLLTPADGSSTNNDEPTLTAIGDAGARIDFYLDGTDIGHTTAGISGVATLTPASALADGPHSAYATETNGLGTASPNSNVDSFTVDTVAPSAPVITAPADGSDSNDNTPTLTATAEPGSTVTFYEDTPGTATLGTVVANGSGVATLTLTSILADGPYTIHATATDAAQNLSPSSSEDHFTIDTVAPAAPTLNSPANLSSTTNPEPTLDVTAEPGSTVTFYVQGVGQLGTATAGGTGDASFTFTSALANGTYCASATATDGAGNTSSSSNTNCFFVAVPPAAPTMATPADGSLTSNNEPTLTATGAPLGSTVTFYIDGSSVGTASTDGSGNASLPLTSALADGQHSVYATDTDAASVTSADSNTNTFTVDTTAPSAPTVTAPADGADTNNNEPTLHATGAEANSTVTFYLDGSSVGTATADGSGNASLALTSALADGQHTVKATDTDAASNVSADSNTNTFTVDTVAPAAPAVTAPADASLTNNNEPTLQATGAEANSTVTFYLDGSSVGTATADGSGNASLTLTSALADGQHTVKATDTDAASNVSADSNTNTFTVDTTAPNAPTVTAPADGSVTNDNEPTLRATGAEAGSTVTFYLDGSSVGTATADGSGKASLSLTTALSDGSHAVKATDTDAASNVSSDSNVNHFTVDTVAPDAPTVTAPANGAIIGTSEPTLTATGAEANSTVTFYIDGTSIGTATADGSGNASLTLTSALADGQHMVKATDTDAASNVSGYSNTDTFTVKTTVAPPAVTSPVNSSVSNNVSPTVTVTGEPGANVTIDIDGTPYGPVTLDGSGHGSVPVGPLSAGQHAIKARQTDAASNVSDWSSTSVWTIKTQTSVHLTAPSGGPLATSTPTVIYTGEAGDDFTLTVDGHTVATGVIPNSGTGSVALTSALADGTHAIAITATDVASNQASDSVVVNIVTSNGHTVQFTQAPALITQQTTAVFAFTDGSSTDTYECSLDGAAFAACPSPDTLSGLANGPHSLIVRGVDSVGNRTAGVQYAWSVDTIAPPAPSILGGPGSVTTPGPATFTISAEPGDTLQCSLDGSAWGPCPTTFTLGNLPVGVHTLQVRQTDQAGNVSPVSTYTWTVVAKPTPSTGASSVRLLVAAKASVYNRTMVDVGCNLNAGAVRSCAVSAYYRGKLVGYGIARYSRTGHQNTVVHVHLNARGRRLMTRAKGGLAVHFTGKAMAFSVSAPLGAAARSTLFGPVRFVLGDVLFDSGSATLTPQAHAIVSQLARRLKGVSTVRCEGYTDSQGNSASNMALGMHRARAVCALLAADGVHASFRTISYGSSRPVASNATSAGRRINRRVVVWVGYRDTP
ncbi:MAG TPA: Ig-like domain-containing protein [Solirubrobacteraceae bacterium]|nr:Ig-like domain-containing protein [Solirubrobacteraceae bacterium]